MKRATDDQDADDELITPADDDLETVVVNQSHGAGINLGSESTSLDDAACKLYQYTTTSEG